MAKTTSWIFGVIFVVAGVWGFFAQPAVGFIAANTMSRIIHLLVGIALLVTAARPAAAVTLKTVGIIYVVLALLGFLSLWNFMAADGITSWFYLVVGIVVAALGFSAKKEMASPAAPTPQM